MLLLPIAQMDADIHSLPIAQMDPFIHSTNERLALCKALSLGWNTAKGQTLCMPSWRAPYDMYRHAKHRAIMHCFTSSSSTQFQGLSKDQGDSQVCVDAKKGSVVIWFPQTACLCYGNWRAKGSLQTLTSTYTQAQLDLLEEGTEFKRDRCSIDSRP